MTVLVWVEQLPAKKPEKKPEIGLHNIWTKWWHCALINTTKHVYIEFQTTWLRTGLNITVLVLHCTALLTKTLENTTEQELHNILRLWWHCALLNII